MSISDEDMHEEPVVGSAILLEDIMELHHKAVSIEKSIPHGSSTMGMDVPDFPWGGGASSLLKSTGKQCSFG
jgi:hypothetical protein